MPDVDVDRIESVARAIFGSDQEAVDRWVDYWRRSRQRNLSLLESFQPLVPFDFKDRRVLDIGCGSGGMGEVLGKEGPRYFGGDYHAHVLKLAPPAKAGRYYMQCSGLELPFPDECFDFVFAFDVIEHLVGGAPWHLRFLSEIQRVLKPTGLFLITTPNRWYPFEGHTRLLFPQYLPRPLADRYIAWRNPGFLKEHKTFAEIQLLSPAWFKRCIRRSGLAFLHELPCAMDRRDFIRIFPLRGLLAYLGLGWYPHAEFWGILVRREMRSLLRLKLKKCWIYEQRQPSPSPPRDFAPAIDFQQGLFNHQLGPGWYWHESDQRAFRWTRGSATCYLQREGKAAYLTLHGFSPRENRIGILANGCKVGDHRIEAHSEFRLQYLLPFEDDENPILEIEVRCAQVFKPEDPNDGRELGVMIFSLGLELQYLPDLRGSGPSRPAAESRSA